MANLIITSLSRSIRAQRGKLLPRHWRILVQTNNGNANYVSIAEAQFRTTAGGSNASGGTYSASTVFNADYNADKAFDGNNTTYWCGVAGNIAGSYLQASFPIETNVREVMIQCNTGGDHITRMPRNFQVQYSYDNSAWVTALTVTNATDWTLGESRTYAVPAI